MDCTVCKGNAGLFYKKCNNGPVCKDCLKKIPSSCILAHHDNGVAKHLCNVFDSKNSEMCRQFLETYKVGNFHFDGNHLLAVIGRTKRNGCIQQGNKNVFSLANVRNLSFIMDNVKIISEKKVTCDIIFTCDFYDSFWTIREVVSKNEVCLAKTEGDLITYSLPVGVQIVWDDIIRSVNTKRQYVENAINNELTTEFDLQYFKSKTLFMLESDFDEKDVLCSYEKLAAGFANDTQKLQKIENAKTVLLDYLEFVKYK